jgi:hypothetical protein
MKKPLMVAASGLAGLTLGLAGCGGRQGERRRRNQHDGSDREHRYQHGGHDHRLHDDR